MDAPERLYLGATFAMGMRQGVHYRTRNKVVAFEENKCIAWHHFAQFTWRYDLDDVEGGRSAQSARIEEMLKAGQLIVCQVTKNPIV